MPKQESISYLEKKGSFMGWKHSLAQAKEILEILKEESHTILPTFFSKKPHKALELLRDEYDIIAEVYPSEHCGLIIKKIGLCGNIIKGVE
jgi:hypothetical protein